MIFFRALLMTALLLATPALSERTVVQALTDLDVSFDPAYANDASVPVVIDSLFDALLARDEAGHLVPAQAERWDISADGLVYTFHLGQNFWTDGKPVTADDFVTAFRRFADPETNDRVVLRYLIEPVANATAIGKGEMPPDALGVEAPDDQTLRIRLAAPTSYFIDILAQPQMSPVPAHLLAKAGIRWADPANLVTNGPYRLEQSVPGRITMIRNERFRTHPDPDRLEFLLVKDTAEQMKLLASGKVDIVLALPDREVAALRSGNWIKNVAVETSPGTTYLAINTRKPPFDDLRVRQAIELIIDRDALNRAQGEYAGVVASTFTPPSMFSYASIPAVPPQPPYDERLARARALFAQAGFDGSHPLPLDLMFRTSGQQGQAAFVGIRAMLGQLPVKVTVSEVDRKELLGRLTDGKFDTAILTWLADYNDPMTFLALFQAGGFANFAGWADPTYQRLLDKALVTTDMATRENVYLEMEALIREAVPIIPLRHTAVSVLSSKDLRMPRLVNGILYPRLVRILHD